MVGKEKSAGVDDPTDNKISVKVTKTGAHSYSIVITPNLAGFGGETSQLVKIYPKDMFRAQVKDPWEFTAMYNPPPKALTDSFHLELKRGAAASTPITVTAGASGAGATGSIPGNVGRVVISDFFILNSLERTMGTAVGAPLSAVVGDTDIDVGTITSANTAARIDKVTDTVCTVSQSSSSEAVAMPLNEAGALRVEVSDETTGAAAEVAHMGFLVVPEVQALNAIRIDSRFSDLGGDNVQTATPNDLDTDISPEAYATYLKNKDTVATKSGTFAVTISCTDKDETATVTGTVVVRS